MSTVFFSLLLLFITTHSTSPVAVAGEGDGGGFVYCGCSQPQFSRGSSYESDVDAVFTSLANAASSSSSYSNFTSGAVVGVFQCRFDASLPACATCVRSAISKISSVCPSASGAVLQLRSCFLRYGNDSFLGQLDTSLLYKNCAGPAPAAPTADLSMRDAALASVAMATPEGVGGTYRAGGAGNVKAVSQCVGDLDGKKCSDCAEMAATQLKFGCGENSGGGEVYLGKCYVRYWSGGGSSSGVGTAYKSAGGGGGVLVVFLYWLLL